MDCALRNTGVVVVDNVNNVHESFNIKTPTGMPDHESIDRIVREFYERLERYNEHVGGKSVTRYYFELIVAAGGIGRQGKATARAGANHVLLWNIRQDGHRPFGVEPNSLNSFFASRYGFSYGRGKSKQIKQITMDMLHRHCAFYTRDDNIADARVCALFGYAHSIEKQRLSPTALSRMA